jgi:hypothetical protein
VSRAPDDLYFVSPLVDALFVGGASLLCFLYFRLTLSGYGAGQVSEQALWLAAALSWVGNWPHFSATSWRLYESRANLARYRLTAWLVPLLTAAATAACFVFPVSFAPYFVKLFVLWSPYHFSAQALGLTLIYARRANLGVSPLARRALTVFFVSSFLVQYSETETSLGTAFLYAMAYPQLHLPAWTPLACKIVMYAAAAVLAYELLPRLRAADRFPWIVLLPVATQYLWFVHGRHDFSFQLLVPFFHALQYLLVAWSVEMHGGRSRARPWFGSARWLALNVVGGGFLFFGLPRLLAGRGFGLEFSILVVAAGVSLHHYFVDGVIWKLQRESRESPLFRNVAWAFGRAP